MTYSSTLTQIMRASLLSTWLTACASGPTLPDPVSTETQTASSENLTVDTTEIGTPAEVDEAPEPQQYGNFTREQLTAMILGELGGQRGRLEEAAERYYHLALDTGDLGIIRRAAEYNAAVGDVEATLTLTDRWIDLAPDEEEARLMRSYHRLQRGEPLAAMRDMEAVLEMGGDADFTAVSARSTEVDATTRQQIRERLAQMRERFPEEPSLYYALAQQLDYAGDREQARTVLDEALDRFGETPRWIIVQAQLLQNIDQRTEALTLLQRGVDRHPGHRLLRYNLAQLLMRTGELRAARDQFNQLLRRAPGDLESLFSLAMLNVELGADREAAAQLEALASANHRRNEALYYLGMIAERNRAPEQALQWYSGVERRSGAYVAAQRRALALLINRSQYDEAREWSDQVSERHPDLTALIRTMEAETLLGAGQRERAAELLDEALTQFPDNVDLLFARVTLNEQRDNQSAIHRDLRRILEQEPENARALNHLGYSLTVRTDRYEEALDLIEQALAQQPDDPAILDSLGWVQFKLGQLDDAVHNLERAYAAFPNHEVAAHLGEALWTRGERERAMTIWREALEQEPDSEYVNDAMDRLAR